MRTRLLFLLMFIALSLSLVFLLCYGAVDIPPEAVLASLIGKETENPVWKIVICEMRLPMGLAAVAAGAGLSVAGLMMQTVFRNPLAGPSVLGVSSGASLGVGLVMLSGIGLGGVAGDLTAVGGALAGSAVVILVLILFSMRVRSSVTLLVVGIMISYLTSSFISLLNFFAPAQGVKSFVVWGLGSFSGVTLQDVPLLIGVVTAVALFSMAYAKPLNAFMLGERYAANVGYSIRRLRISLLVISGILTAIVTAYCGPVGFIGLIVPHIARMIFRTSDHFVMLPATMLTGAVLTVFCAVLTVSPGMSGILPLNAVTPVVGVPVILYILVKERMG